MKSIVTSVTLLYSMISCMYARFIPLPIPMHTMANSPFLRPFHHQGHHLPPPVNHGNLFTAPVFSPSAPTVLHAPFIEEFYPISFVPTKNLRNHFDDIDYFQSNFYAPKKQKQTHNRHFQRYPIDDDEYDSPYYGPKGGHYAPYHSSDDKEYSPQQPEHYGPQHHGRQYHGPPRLHRHRHGESEQYGPMRDQYAPSGDQYGYGPSQEHFDPPKFDEHRAYSHNYQKQFVAPVQKSHTATVQSTPTKENPCPSPPCDDKLKGAKISKMERIEIPLTPQLQPALKASGQQSAQPSYVIHFNDSQK